MWLKHYKRILNTLTASREEWLRERKKGIGGSDIGTLMGFNPYSSSFMVYINKTTDYNKDLSDNEAVYWGTTLEDIVAKEFEKRSGKKVRRLNAMLQSTKSSFAIADIDFDIVGEPAGLECKTTNAFNVDEWKNAEIPASYICQCQWYMYVTGYKKWYIACLIGGQKFVWKEIERDNELINYMVQTAKDFWENYILKNEAPPMDGSSSCTEYLDNVYTESADKTIYLTPSVEALVDDLAEKKKLVKEIQRQIKDLENRVKQYLGEAERGEGRSFSVVWKTQYGASKLNIEALIKDYKISNISDYYLKTRIRKFSLKENK